MKKLSLVIVVMSIVASINAQKENIWSAKKANHWYKKQGWLVGGNFLPSNAINQLEMWQADTFDTTTISREFGYAEGIGMNTMRVFLHDLLWKEDAVGFKKRIDIFLTIASNHHIKPLFVFFDDCHDPNAKLGKQRDPKPGIHNSGWVKSPSNDVYNDSTKWGYLQAYVTDILKTYKTDKRILMWDLYNEPTSRNKGTLSLPLLKKVFEWAWAVRPSQPLTSSIQNTITNILELKNYQKQHCDIITFHNYGDTNSLKRDIEDMQKLGRPLICTEYMARPSNSRFITHLPVFKRYNVGAINWGLVSGKSNTIYAWGDKSHTDGSEPAVWFHDVFRKDGTPYDVKETDLIRQLTLEVK